MSAVADLCFAECWEKPVSVPPSVSLGFDSAIKKNYLIKKQVWRKCQPCIIHNFQHFQKKWWNLFSHQFIICGLPQTWTTTLWSRLMFWVFFSCFLRFKLFRSVFLQSSANVPWTKKLPSTFHQPMTEFP